MNFSRKLLPGEMVSFGLIISSEKIVSDREEVKQMRGKCISILIMWGMRF